MDDLGRALNELVPRFRGPSGDWGRVLRDADVAVPRRRRRRIGVTAAVLAASVVAALAVLAWPLSGSQPTLVERALAAVGQGPVLHAVFDSGAEYAIVELETGDRRVARRVQEVWYDDDRGFHQVERFEGVVQSDLVRPPEAGSGTEALYREFASGYRDALAAGEATVVEKSELEGEPVAWVRVLSSGGHAVEVAVSERTFLPVALRGRTEGEPADTRIVAYVRAVETLPEGAGDFTADEGGEGGFSFTGGGGPAVELPDAASVLGRPAVWAGPSTAGLPLAYVGETTRDWSTVTEGPRDYETTRGILLFYGAVDERGEPVRRKGHVAVHLTPRLDPLVALDIGVQDYLPPEGSILVRTGRGAAGLLRAGGLIVFVEAPDEETLLEVARSLRPFAG